MDDETYKPSRHEYPPPKPDFHQHPPSKDDTRDFLFLKPEGGTYKVRPEDLPLAWCTLADCPLNPRISGIPLPKPSKLYRPIGTPDNLDGASTTPSRSSSPSNSPAVESEGSKATESKMGSLKGKMIYNELGILVEADKLDTPIDSNVMGITHMVKLIHVNWQHHYKRKTDDIIAALLNDKSSLAVNDKALTISERLISWEFKPISSRSNDNTPDGFKVAVYGGLPRVLDVGCDTGEWCFTMKKQHPDWIVEGVDDVDRWTKDRMDIEIKDFMDGKISDDKSPGDYFSRVHASQDNPEFTVRSINSLLTHENPIPHNLYGIVRGSNIFAKVNSFRAFLEDVRLILQPDGVVEFLEVDPRPRKAKSSDGGPSQEEHTDDHTSRAMTDWTDNIADRFKAPLDEELATDVPGWTARIDERIKASLHPQDGVPAANLKSWVEGAGFWDVKQVIVKLPVGGTSRSGQLLKNLILWKTSMEDEIPRLLQTLPKLELEALESGTYFLNLHIVTGRKPRQPRLGDLLLDGSRQEMTESMYDAMARHGNVKEQRNQWERNLRFDLAGKLTDMMDKLQPFQSSP